ncbi:MAG: AAA family ATPase [Acidimicrobiales bacterium]
MAKAPAKKSRTPSQEFKNPYRPGAGHMPPYLAGREAEFAEFDRLLEQDTILENMVLTGLRGVGKTVLLERFKPHAMQAGWLWVGADLSETASISEANLAERLLADLSVATSAFSTEVAAAPPVGFHAGKAEGTKQLALSYNVLNAVYQETPGLVADKLKGVLEFVHAVLHAHGRNHIIFAYDEAQNLSDHADRDQFPLSVLLDVFQSIQRKGLPFMLVLTGLPTLFPKLVDARTFAERMFRVVTLGRLTDGESRQAIRKPIEVANCPISFNDESVETVCRQSGGYPYFIQFICREVFDLFIQQMTDEEPPGVPVDAIQRKLDTDFFAGRWAKVTDRQRQLLWLIATLDTADDEFTIQEVVEAGKLLLPKAFSSSHVNQMLASLGEHGLIYKNRFGKYSFAVPLLGGFIARTYDPPTAS